MRSQTALLGWSLELVHNKQVSYNSLFCEKCGMCVKFMSVRTWQGCLQIFLLRNTVGSIG